MWHRLGERTMDDIRDALARRAPKYVMKDPNPGYAGIAVDPTRGEVILADENMFGIHVFDHMTNTPPRGSRHTKRPWP